MTKKQIRSLDPSDHEILEILDRINFEKTFRFSIEMTHAMKTEFEHRKGIPATIETQYTRLFGENVMLDAQTREESLFYGGSKIEPRVILSVDPLNDLLGPSEFWTRISIKYAFFEDRVVVGWQPEKTKKELFLLTESSSVSFAAFPELFQKHEEMLKHLRNLLRSLTEDINTECELFNGTYREMYGDIIPDFIALWLLEVKGTSA